MSTIISFAAQCGERGHRGDHGATAALAGIGAPVDRAGGSLKLSCSAPSDLVRYILVLARIAVELLPPLQRFSDMGLALLPCLVNRDAQLLRDFVEPSLVQEAAVLGDQGGKFALRWSTPLDLVGRTDRPDGGCLWRTATVGRSDSR